MPRERVEPDVRGRMPAFALLIGVCSALVAMAFVGPVAQDWIPFRVASTLSIEGRWRDLYPGGDARHLFDVSDAYRQAAERDVRYGDVPAFRADQLTAFVSPPPAALLLRPAGGASWQASLLFMRLALAIPLVASLLLFSRLGCRDERQKLHWSRVCAWAAPLLLYTITLSQPSAWLAAAAALSLVSTTIWIDAIGGTVLALAILTKATPLLIAVALCVTARRRLAWFALAVAAIGVAGSWAMTGTVAWTEFLTIASHLGRTVLTEWNNASLDAAIMRWSAGGADSYLRQPGAIELASSSLLRVALVGIAAWSGLRKCAVPGQRIAAIWIGWLALTPLLWLHYLTVLVPLLGMHSRGRPRVGVACAALLSAPAIMLLAGAPPTAAGYVATCAWIASAACILWPGRADRATSPAIATTDHSHE